MKVLVVLAALVACGQTGSVSNIAQKLAPRFATGFILQGQDAVAHSAPYIISLSIRSIHSHSCGGTIIKKDWVLTAAHCISRKHGIHVIAGLHERLNFDNRTQSRVVDWAKIHEKFTGSVGPYDIAILHLSKPLEFNEYVQPAVLPARDEIHSGETHLYGWGHESASVPVSANILQTVKTQIIEYNACKEVLPEDAPLHESNICSSALQEGISACMGDSGGPLVVEYKGAASELIGIVSWGYSPCGLKNKPSIYTRVSAYIDWISKMINAYYSLY